MIAVDGTDEAQENTWRTTSGESLPYTTFHPGEPNGGAEGNCLDIHQGYDRGFVDNRCDHSNKFTVCERNGRTILIK